MKKIKVVKIADATYTPRKIDGTVNVGMSNIDGLLKEVEKRCDILIKLSLDKTWVDVLKEVKTHAIRAAVILEHSLEAESGMKVK